MGQEERRLLPHLGNQLIEIIGRRRALAGHDALRRRSVGEQAIFGIVDQLAFLAFLDLFDQQPQLFLNLIEWMAVQVGDAGLHVEHGGDRIEEVLARLLVIIDKSLRQIRIAVAARAAFDVKR